MLAAPRAVPDEKRRYVLRRIGIHPLFGQMARLQGIDLAGRWTRGLERMLLDALDRCAACAQPKACRAWLARRAGPGYPGFCPNARVLEACRIMDPGAPSLTKEVDRAYQPSLAEMLADPIVGQVMRTSRPRTARLLAILAGEPRRLIERLSRPTAAH